jgi:hypothetical protein
MKDEEADLLRTEVGVVRHPRLRLHEGLGGPHERGSLVGGTLLVATAEVLAGILGKPDVPAEGVVVLDEVINEGLGVSAVEVSGNGVDLAMA